MTGFIGKLGNMFMESQGKRHTLTEHVARLERGGAKIKQLAAKINDSDRNRQVLNHIIGIERWGQRRLKVFLGAERLQDEYNNYRPARETDWITLQREFEETRQETVDLARQIEAKSVTDMKSLHNQFGELSPRGWLQYLTFHADTESKRMK